MKNFLKDSDGFSVADFEKLILAFLSVVGCMVIFYLVLATGFVDVNLNYFVLGILSLFVVRKIFKYNLDAKTIELESNQTITNTNDTTIVSEEDLNR